MTNRINIRALGGALLVAVIASGARAQRPAVSAWTPFFGGGLAAPLGSYGSAMGVGVQVNGGSEYRFNPDFGVRPEADLMLYSSRAGGGSVSVFGFGASAIWHWSNSGGFRPYGLVRLGINTSSWANGSYTSLGLAPGAGGDFRCGRSTCFVETKLYLGQQGPPGGQALTFAYGMRF
ncbi:MAG: hypothetical protein HYX65_09460 [Gemmatimonadetes bacterium]|nr:hypothetical protein [Gemmatimonadota bacterium]